MNLSEQLMRLHRPKTINEKIGFKGIKKLLNKFKPFKKIKKSKNAFNDKIANKKHKKGFWKKLFEGMNEEYDKKRIDALAKFLNIPTDEIEDSGYGLEADGGEYVVLTDAEANQKLKEYIEESVWAFNADFLASHWGTQEQINDRLGLESSYYDEEAEENVVIDDADEVFYLNLGMSLEEWISNNQEEAEDSNDDFMKLIINFDRFVSDAERSDGRGHFLSNYDGEENEVDGFYIYRTN